MSSKAQKFEFPTRREGLVTAALCGDRRAAERLVEQTYEMIYASLFKLCGGDAELAADLTQDTYAKAWKSLHQFTGKARFGTWLYRIAYNVFLNHVRRPARVRTFEDGEDEQAIDLRPSPAVTAEERLRDERLRRAVLALPEELRFAVSARYWGELPVKEIARLQEITPMGVRKRLKRAFLSLELALEEGR